MERVNVVLKHITKVMLNSESDKNLIRQRYCFDENIKGGKFFQCLQSINDVCFIGDSLTHGTLNGGRIYPQPSNSKDGNFNESARIQIYFYCTLNLD